MIHAFMENFPRLRQMNMELLWLPMLTSTVMYVKYVVEGFLPDNEETENTMFQLLSAGLTGYLRA